MDYEHETNIEPQVPEAPKAPETPKGPEPPVADEIPREYIPDAPKVKRPKRTRHPGRRTVALALCCSLLGGAAGAGGVLLAQQMGATGNGGKTVSFLQGLRENTVIDMVEIETGKLMTTAEVYAANVHSTVGITTTITTNYWGQQSTSAASGSGFILSEDGYILTNYHVVEDSDKITVSMYNDKSYAATMIGFDASNDIAVLKVDATGLSPVILGDSDNLNVGDTVAAIGNPLGELTFSLTAGLISAKDRQVTMSNGLIMNLLQTDCAINSGNSGGALFNLYGEVIGITNAKYSTSANSSASIDNIGFAIPINRVKDIVKSIIEKGYVTKPYIGVSVTDVSAQMQSFGLPKGAAVTQVMPQSPAAQGGLKVNDIVTRANAQKIESKEDLVYVVGQMNPGDLLKLTVYRQGKIVEVTITVGEQIQSATGR